MRSNDLDDTTSLPSQSEALQGLGERFPLSPFTVVSREVQPRARTEYRGAPDALIDLEWEGQIQRFAVEYKSSGTPKQIDYALQQVRRYTWENPSVAPLIVAPFLRTELLERLLEERISAVDLSGNYAVVVPGRWLVVRTGSKNRYPSSAPIKNVYRGKSSLVARALMLKEAFDSATSIMKELTWFGSVSLPTISKVLKALEDELIIERKSTIKVIQPDRLLDNLVANYKAPEVSNRLRGKIGLTPTLATRLNANASAGGVPYAADSPAQYTVLPSSEQVTRIYTQSITKLLRDIQVDAASRFPDAELLETTDLSVFYGRQQQGDLYWTSPLQVYLELATGEKRERQAAAQIRENLLTFKYR